jgi:hypothetical protein
MPTQSPKSISESERIDAFCRELGLILRRILEESQGADQIHKPASIKPIKKIKLEIK